MIVGTEKVLYSWCFYFYKFIKYIIYFKHILKYGWVGSSLVGWQVFCTPLSHMEYEGVQNVKIRNMEF